MADDAVIIRGNTQDYKVCGDVQPLLQPIKAWSAYGQSRPATRIRFQSAEALDWNGHIKVEII